MDIKKKLYWMMQAGISCFCTEHPKTDTNFAKISSEMPATMQATASANQAKDLPTLNADKQAFNLSALKKTASHTIFGQGNINPQLMCIMEMPDADSDRSGQTFAGAQGEQFKKMMSAINLDISDVYLTYLSPWRTPGNRPLTEAERALFLPFLAREIQLVQPKKILLFGAGNIDSLAKARGNWHSWNTIPVRVTLALSSLKSTPQRRQAWEDLQAIEKQF